MWRQPGPRRQEPSLRRQAARGRRALPQPCRDLGCSKLPNGASCRHSPRPSNRRLTWVSLHLLSLSDTTEEESRWPLRMSHGWSVAPVLSQSFSTLSDPQGPLGLQRSHSWDQPRADQSSSLQVGPPRAILMRHGCRGLRRVVQERLRGSGTVRVGFGKASQGHCGPPFSPNWGTDVRQPQILIHWPGHRQPQSLVSGTGMGDSPESPQERVKWSARLPQSLPVTMLEPEKI